MILECILQLEMLHQSLLQIFFFSHFDDNDDSNGEIVTNGKTLYSALLLVTPIFLAFVIVFDKKFHIPLSFKFLQSFSFYISTLCF
jgi:hypothetical protein